eukprot:3733130-Rhodomonas_salina.3
MGAGAGALREEDEEAMELNERMRSYVTCDPCAGVEVQGRLGTKGSMDVEIVDPPEKAKVLHSKAVGGFPTTEGRLELIFREIEAAMKK